MQKLEDRDYFTDYEVAKDPYPFFEAVREHGPIYQPEGKDYLIVTGFDETIEILNNHHDFSAIIGLAGAAAPLYPQTPAGVAQPPTALRGESAGEFALNRAVTRLVVEVVGPGDEDHPTAAAPGPGRGREAEPVEAGQAQVGDQQVEGVGLQVLERVLGGGEVADRGPSADQGSSPAA